MIHPLLCVDLVPGSRWLSSLILFDSPLQPAAPLTLIAGTAETGGKMTVVVVREVAKRIQVEAMGM
jgi:hypothetical protein